MMKVKYVKSETYQVIPYIRLKTKPKEEETAKKDAKELELVKEINKMNRHYGPEGPDGHGHYHEAPHLSYKLIKENGLIYQYVSIPVKVISQIRMALQQDTGGCKFQLKELALQDKNMHVFAVTGHDHLSTERQKELELSVRPIFQMINKNEKFLFSVTAKEAKNHSEIRKKMQKKLRGIDNWKGWIKHHAKIQSKKAWKKAYEKTQGITRDIADGLEGWAILIGGGTKKEVKREQSEQKFAMETTRFMVAEILFAIWTEDEDKVRRIQERIQKSLEVIQGENDLKLVKVKPDLKRLVKGHLSPDTPKLLVTRKELYRLVHVPKTEELPQDYYAMHEEKTEIPQYALNYEVGALALGRKMDTGEIIAMPRAVTEEYLDDRGTPTIISGKKGSGKTQLLINQVADTFCLGASSMEEWKEKARSAIVVDVADGEMVKEIYELVPPELKDRVIFLNHADLENPIPVINHDLLNLHKVDGFEEEIANMETEILMDSLKDKNSTVAIERHFKMALQASYAVGQGNIIDAMRIIEDKRYRDKIIDDLEEKEEYVFLPSELRKMDDIFSEPKALETIDNRISRLKNIQPWIDCLAQKPMEGLDFWKWINGDENGAYLVLIYIPKRINKSFRSFLFAHYLMKIWYMTEAREIINKSDRREFLVIVDELHQIFGHRAVPIVLEAVYKEARKYRGRYTFTIHGWSSIKDKEIKEIVRDASGNYIMLKGGDDMFSSLEKEFRPYTVDDFNELMKMKYCGIFKVDIHKQTYVFQAKLMEPASIRFKKHRFIDLESFRAMKNKYGRPKNEVRASMKKGGVKPCNSQNEIKRGEPTMEDALASFTGGRGFQN